MRKVVLALLAVIIAAGGVVYFSVQAPQERAVTVGYGGVLAAEPLFIAIDKGFFAREGLDVTPVLFESSNAVTDALASGKLDAAFYGSTLPVFAAHSVSPGSVLVMGLSDMTLGYPVDSVLVRTNSSITSLKDLDGRRVGVYPGNTAANFMARLLAANGVDTRRVEFVRMQPANQLQALEAGAVDAVHTYEPVDSIALESGKARAIHNAVYGTVFPHTPLTGAYISGEFVKKRPRQAKAVAKVLYSSYEFMRANDKESREIAAKWLKLKPEIAGRMHFIYEVPASQYDAGRLQAFADLLYETGDLKQRINASETIYAPNG